MKDYVLAAVALACLILFYGLMLAIVQILR